MYYYGEGFAQNYAEALRWFGEVAVVFPGAQEYLGFMYSNGEGVARDYTEALKWYGKAAEASIATAFFSPTTHTRSVGRNSQ